MLNYKTTVIKIAAFVFSALLCASNLYAQEDKKEEPQKTKMDAFVSKTGVIRKFVDVTLSGLKGTYMDVAETRIRKVSAGTTSLYFYQIEKNGEYGSTTSSIEYTDLLEVIKALETLKTEVNQDVATNPDYLENKFVTEDGFQVGYYISKGKANWYLTLEGRGSDASIFVSSVEVLEAAFTQAKEKINMLRK